jgi:ribonuclease HI
MERIFLQIVEGIFASYDEKEIQLFVGFAQKIWMRRNDVVHGNLFTHPTELMVQARKDLDNYRRVIDGDDTHMLVSTATPVQTWMAPTLGWLKANWDASIKKDQSWMGFRVVVRDERGSAVVALCKTSLGRLDPQVVEARAVLMAIQVCKEMGFSKVHFEGDAKVVIDAVNSLKPDKSYKGLVVEDIRQELQGMEHLQMTFVHQEGNHAAHTLAKLGTTIVWINNGSMSHLLVFMRLFR